jgi:hypothetical protein
MSLQATASTFGLRADNDLLLVSTSQAGTRPRPTIHDRALEIMCASPNVANASMLPATFARVRLNIVFFAVLVPEIQ